MPCDRSLDSGALEGADERAGLNDLTNMGLFIAASSGCLFTGNDAMAVGVTERLRSNQAESVPQGGSR